MSNTRVWSMHDLMSNVDFKQAVVDNDKKTINTLLYQVGVDTSQEWKIVERLHKPLSFKNYEEPIFGPMVEYFPRTDKSWLTSGYASVEDVIEATPDSFMRSELMGMNRQSNFTGQGMDQYGCSEVDVEINDTIKE